MTVCFHFRRRRIKKVNYLPVWWNLAMSNLAIMKNLAEGINLPETDHLLWYIKCLKTTIDHCAQSCNNVNNVKKRRLQSMKTGLIMTRRNCRLTICIAMGCLGCTSAISCKRENGAIHAILHRAAVPNSGTTTT